jgi:hypothetical protein
VAVNRRTGARRVVGGYTVGGYHNSMATGLKSKVTDGLRQNFGLANARL